MKDYIEAHKYSSNHRNKLETDVACGCYYCLRIYSPKEIVEWIPSNDGDDSNESDGTALCPYCGVDSVIGESSGFPITKEFLKKMKSYWFIHEAEG